MPVAAARQPEAGQPDQGELEEAIPGSRDFQAAVIEAAVGNQEAPTMADYFSDSPGTNAVIAALADAFYEAAIDQRPDV